MAGLLQSAKPKGDLSPEAIEAKMHLTGKQPEQLKRIVLAGMKVMFDKSTHKLMLDQLNGPGTIAQKIGQGVAGLLAMLWQESKQSLPPQLLIPAGMVLVAHAAKFLRDSGQDISDQDIGQAIEAMTTALLHAGGVDSQKLAAIGGGERKMPPMPAKKTAVAAQGVMR